jgi:hypothetical protein
MRSSGSGIIENLHKYNLHRKQLGLLLESDHQIWKVTAGVVAMQGGSQSPGSSWNCVP